MKKAAAFLISGFLFWETIRFLQKSGNGLPFLSCREQKILGLMAEGYADDEISECLHISNRTLGKYLHNIPKKLNLPDISCVIEYALEKGSVRIAYA